MRRIGKRRALRLGAAAAVLSLGIAWLTGLPGIGLVALAVWRIPAPERDRHLWLPHYAVAVEALPLEGLAGNVSGLTFNPDTGTLFTVINRPPEIVELATGGAVLRRIPLVGASDVEGITHASGERFVVVDESNGRLSWVEIGPATREVDLAASPFLALGMEGLPNMGFEGLSWDHRTGTLFVAQEMWPAKVRQVTGLDRVLAGEGLGIEMREWKPDLAFGHPVADLSSITVHEATGNIVLLSDLTSVLVEFSPEGRPVSLLPLWRGWHGLRQGVPQAEGVAIGPDGAIYIVSEPNLFYRFERTETAPWVVARR